VTSVLVDLDTRRILLSEGPPCEGGYQELDVPLLAVRTG
jgi:hypothetical protein